MQGNNKQNKTWLKAAITAIAPFLLIGCMSSVNNNEAQVDSRNSQISEFVNTREAETEQQQIPPTSKTELTNQYTHLPSTSSELKAYANNLEWEDGSKKTFSKLHRCSTDYSQMPYSHNIKTELRELEDKLK